MLTRAILHSALPKLPKIDSLDLEPYNSLDDQLAATSRLTPRRHDARTAPSWPSPSGIRRWR